MKMFSRLLLRLMVPAAALVTAKADLIEGTAPNFGAGSLTIDTRTGLAWLDVNLSLNLSYLGAEAAMLPGQPLFGFRHAAAREVQGLFDSAGVPVGFNAPSTPGFDATISLLNLIGVTEYRAGPDNVSYPSASAIAAEVWSPSLGYFAPVPELLYGYNLNGVLVYDVTTTPGLEYGLNTSAPTIGNWLVAVPEPDPLRLFVLAGGLWLAFGVARSSLRPKQLSGVPRQPGRRN